MAKRAAIYVRVSSEQQSHAKGAGQGAPDEAKTSPRAQEKDCRSYCLAHGYEVAGVYRDTEKYRASGQPLVQNQIAFLGATRCGS